LLYPQGGLGGEGGKIHHGHEGALVPQVDLQSLGVAGLPQPLYGVAVAQEVWIDRLVDPGFFGGGLDDLPSSRAVHIKELVFGLELLVESVALKAVGQVVGKSHSPGLPPLADEIHDGVAVLHTDFCRRQTQSFGDPEARL
jgi:hypothetical protein